MMGFAIFFDTCDPNLVHGQTSALYADPGFEAAYLSNAERQAIYENDIAPDLESG